MKRKIAFILVLLMVLCIGCGKKADVKKKPIKTSDTYMIGFDYSAYDYFGNGYPVVSKIRYDKTVEALYVWMDDAGNECSREVVTKMDNDSFDYLCHYIDLEKLYYLDPEVRDPDKEPKYDYCYLTIYAEDDTVLKECGGYAPQNQDFNTMHGAIVASMPDDYKYVYDKFQRDGCLTDENVINHTMDLKVSTETPDFLSERLESAYTGDFDDYRALYPVRVACSNEEFIADMESIFAGAEFSYDYLDSGELISVFVSGKGTKYLIFRTELVDFEVKAGGVFWRSYAEEGMYADMPIVYDSTGKYAMFCYYEFDDEDMKRFIGFE